MVQKLKQKAGYSKNKAFDKQYYLDLILKFRGESLFCALSLLDEMLWNKFPDWMTDGQRKNRVTNLFSGLRINTKIKNIGTMKNSLWVLHKN